MDIKEEDLYGPVAAFLKAQGYNVKGEVSGCDVMAQKDGVFLVVELKKNVSLTLLLQAMERKKITHLVYVAVPRPRSLDRRFRQIKQLLKKLELGLMTVSLDSPLQRVDVHLAPLGVKKTVKGKRAQRAVKDFSNRQGDFNTGGVNRKKIITSHLERSIHAAVLLQNGQLPVKTLRTLTGDLQVGQLMQKNFYNWFIRVERGVYALGEEGKAALKKPDLKPVVDFYTAHCQKSGGV